MRLALKLLSWAPICAVCGTKVRRVRTRQSTGSMLTVEIECHGSKETQTIDSGLVLSGMAKLTIAFLREANSAQVTEALRLAGQKRLEPNKEET